MIKRTLLLSLLLAVGSLQAQDQTPPADNTPDTGSIPAPEQALPATPDTGSVQASEQAPPATPNTDSVQAPDQAPPAEDAAASPPAPDLVVAPQMAALAVCATCHGADGNNWVRKDDGAFGKTDGGADSPKLTGQHSDYLFKQFGDFKSGARENAIMNGMITMLPDDQMKEAAKFYAAQKFEPAAAANAADSDAYKSGERIWRAGIASKGLPACAACHGPLGKGMPAQYPALAGQFPEYTESQLKAFRDVVRANDPSKMMRDIALKMTDPEIKAVADYAAGLR